MPSQLAVINALLPKDSGSRLVRRDIAYGPDVRHKLDIYAPRSTAEQRPVVFFIHGGGWERGERAEYAFAGRALAARGYVTVVPSYRLAPEVHFPDFITDCAEALGWVTREIEGFGGDPGRVGLMGHSAGAHIAIMLALDPALQASSAPKCAVGLSGPYDFYPFDVHASIQAFGQVAEPLLSQPVHLPLDAAPPMLLVHGLADRSVRPANSRALAEKLQAAGRKVEHIEYDGVSHFLTLGGLMMPLRWRVPVLQDSSRFLARHLFA